MKLPLASTLRNRTHQTNKDARLLNGFAEAKGEVFRVFKRPSLVGTFAPLEAGDGFGQGLFVFSVPDTSLTGNGGYGTGSNQTLVAIQNDVLNNSPVPLARYLAFSTQPINWKIATAMSPAVVVSVTDAFGNVMTGTSGTVTISLSSNPSGGTLSGTLTAALSGGYATFSNLKIDKVGGGYKFAATAPNLRSARSNVFKIISNLSWTVQPSNTAPGATISVPEVSVVDSASGVITGYVGNVTVEIGTNGGSPAGTLSGTTTVAAVSGVASFTNLSIDEEGDGYTLVASASAGNLVDKTSDAFNIDSYALVISADTSNYNVYNAFVAAYGTPPTSVTLSVTVNAGKIVSASSTAAAAMTWGSSWTGTPTFTLINNGYIVGKGGAGGKGGDNDSAPAAAQNGSAGGKAIELSGNTVAITNASGSIWGGGGGSGGGGNVIYASGDAAGGGGGGPGAGAGTGGLGGGSIYDTFVPGLTRASAAGTAQSGALSAQSGTAGGLGAVVEHAADSIVMTGGTGGTGGNYGSAGVTGSTGSGTGGTGSFTEYGGGTGGVAGKAINLTGGTANFVSGSGSPNVKGTVS